MFEDLLQPISTKVLLKGMDAASLRQQVIANNIANVNTPGFKRSDVEFTNQLRDALDRMKNGKTGRRESSGAQLERLAPRVVQEKNTSYRSDGNNVDIDAEMAELAINNMWYNAMSQHLSTRLNIISTAINEGRR